MGLQPAVSQTTTPLGSRLKGCSQTSWTIVGEDRPGNEQRAAGLLVGSPQGLSKILGVLGRRRQLKTKPSLWGKDTDAQK